LVVEAGQSSSLAEVVLAVAEAVLVVAVALVGVVAVSVVVALQEDGNGIFFAIIQTYFYLKSINATVL
jgi:hypothetical protein